MMNSEHFPPNTKLQSSSVICSRNTLNLYILIPFRLYPLNPHSTGNSKLDEARRKREEKKMQRQRELEARRAARSAGGPGAPSSGPMKLGAKKIQLDWVSETGGDDDDDDHEEKEEEQRA